MTKSIRRFRSTSVHSLLFAGICTSCGSPVTAQSIHVFTELQRIDPMGNVIPQDRGPANDPRTSREVLSPALVRNAASSFLVAVQPPPGTPYWFYIGENPEKLIEITAYKAIFEKTTAGNFQPDRLEKIELPYNGLVPEKHIPGQTTELFLIDVFVPKEAVVRRMKLEPQMWIPDRWIIYPMEIRILPTQLLAKAPDKGAAAPPGEPADATYRGVFLSYLCENPEKSDAPGPLSIRSMILRNARRDAMLAATLGRPEIGIALGYEGEADWCKAPPPAAHPERVLRLRDRLLKGKALAEGFPFTEREVIMAQDELDMSPLCPRCGVSTVTPSKAQTWPERMGRMLFVGNYRCHTCLKRFTWFMSPLVRIRDRDSEHVRAHRVGAGG